MKEFDNRSPKLLQISNSSAPETIMSSHHESLRPLYRRKEEFVQWVRYSCHSLISSG